MSPALKTITTKGGARFTVAAENAPRFEALLNDLEAAGYPIKGDQSGGYNPRNIAGTNTPSQHSYGNAVDVNWRDNANGDPNKPGTIPREVALDLAAKNGFVWGGTWAGKRFDPMHFEVADNAPAPPVADRGVTAYAGNAAPPPVTDVPQAAPAPDAGAPPAAPAEQPSTLQTFADTLVANATGGETEKKPEAAFEPLQVQSLQNIQAPRRRIAPGALLRAVASRSYGGGGTEGA